MEFEKQLNRIKKGQVSLVYLVQGKEPYLQELARKVFLDTIVAPEDQDLNVGRFNMDEVSVQTAVQDAESVPFFGDRRLVMIDNPTFLTGEKEKKSIDHQLDRLQAYLENPMDSSVMVFFAPYEKLDQRKKIVKQLKKVAVLLDASELSERDVRQYIKDYLRSQQYGIQEEALNTLLLKTQYSLTTCMKELDKLMVAEIGTYSIRLETVEALVAKTLEQSIFDFGEAILNKDSKRALQIYHDMLLQKEDPIKMNAILLGQFRLLLQVSYLKKAGYQEPEIQKTLAVHPYRVKLALNQCRRYG
ncbi:MAG: DNA polymerase III subunit delta, partial [Streptococcus sp.]|nr:DNA polymerase III subunit delta [Streptococcus sp.]